MSPRFDEQKKPGIAEIAISVMASTVVIVQLFFVVSGIVLKSAYRDIISRFSKS